MASDPSRPWITGDLVVRPTDDQSSLQDFLTELRGLLPVNPAGEVPTHQCCAKLHLVDNKPFRLEWNTVVSDPDIGDPDIGLKSFLEGPSVVPKLPSSSPSRKPVTTNGVNGEVFKIRCVDDKRGLDVNVLLKESKQKSSDNLFIEWFNGRGINYLRKRVPIFPQTYQLLATDYNNPPSYEPVYTPDVPLATLVQIVQGGDLAVTSQYIEANHISLFDFMKMIREQSQSGKMTPQTRLTHEHRILWTLYFLYTSLYLLRNQLAHNDLHDSNIILITLQRPIHVSITNASGYVEQIKLTLFPVIIDFGRSMVIEPSHRIYTTDLYWIYRNIGQSEPEDEQNGLYGCFNTFRSIIFKKNILGDLGSTEFKLSIAPLIAKYEQMDLPNEAGESYRLSDQLSSVASHVRQTTSSMGYPTDLNLIPDNIKDPYLLRQPDYDYLHGDDNTQIVQMPPDHQPSSIRYDFSDRVLKPLAVPSRPLTFFQLLNSGRDINISDHHR